MFRLSSTPGKDFVEIEVVEEADSTYAAGDVRLLVSVACGEFSGKAHGWVLREEIDRFARAVSNLNASLTGSAVLRSVSPGELELEILAVTSRGHLAVKGSVGRHAFSEERLYWNSVHFGFEFEPGQLSNVIGERWVSGNAA